MGVAGNLTAAAFKMKLSKNFNRLILRNCRIESIERNQNSLDIVFDHAKLDNLSEENISSPVVLGRTTLKIHSPFNEILKVFYADHQYKVIHLTSEAAQSWIKIEHTDINEEKQTLAFSGDYLLDGKKGWAEFSIQFGNCELEFETCKPFTED